MAAAWVVIVASVAVPSQVALLIFFACDFGEGNVASVPFIFIVRLVRFAVVLHRASSWASRRTWLEGFSGRSGRAWCTIQLALAGCCCLWLRTLQYRTTNIYKCFVSVCNSLTAILQTKNQQTHNLSMLAIVHFLEVWAGVVNRLVYSLMFFVCF